MRRSTFAGILLFSFFSSTALAEKIAEKNSMVCRDCGTVSKAKNFAKKFANPLQCNETTGPNIKCSSIDKIVTILDFDTGNSYKFNIYHDSNPPWPVEVSPRPLSSADKYGFKRLSDFLKATEYSIKSASTATVPASSSIQKARDTN